MHPDLGQGGRQVCDVIVALTWAMFFVDFAVRVGLATRTAPAA